MENETREQREEMLEESCLKAPFTMDQLVLETARLIPMFAREQSRYRVNVYPDDRTIRYYFVRGLIDRSTESQGTASLFNSRQLLQVVAIKKLQTEYLPLRKIKEVMAGLDNEGLKMLLIVEPEPALNSREYGEFIQKMMPVKKMARMASLSRRRQGVSEPKILFSESCEIPEPVRSVLASEGIAKERQIGENWLRVKVTDDLELSLKSDSPLIKDRETVERLSIKVRLFLEEEKRRER